MAAIYLSGLVPGLALIMPIGPQNVFVVGQGLATGLPRALWSVLAAGLCDSLLIVVGAAGVSGIISAVPAVRLVLLAGGAVFLTWLGVQALRSYGASLAWTQWTERRPRHGRSWCVPPPSRCSTRTPSWTP